MNRNKLGMRGISRVAVSLAAGVGVVALSASAVATASVRAHSSSATVVKSKHWRGAMVVAAFNGHSLYAFSKDPSGKSTCYKKCSQTWYPYIASSGKVVAAKGSHISQKHLGTVLRKNGKRQVTYWNQPLYLYRFDTKASDTKGEMKYQYGGQWYLLNVNGGPQTRGGY